MEDDREQLALLGRSLPPEFAIRVVAIAPGCERTYDESEWQDAIVAIECGEVELECQGGSRQRFGRGAALWMDGLPLRALHNRGREPALLVAVSRRRSAERSGRNRSTASVAKAWTDEF